MKLNLIVVLAIAFIGTFGCSQNDKPVLRLGTNVWIGYELLHLAERIGAFPSEKVRLVDYPSASEVIRAFRNKNIEIASLTLDEVLLLAQDDIPLKIILIHDISNGGDTILARPPMKSMQDIKGKRVAVESSALGAYVISRALEMNDLSLKDISVVHLDINDHEDAYHNGKVDVVVNFEPVRTRLLAKGAKEVFSSKEIYGEIVDVLIVHQSAIEENETTLSVLIDAWFTALDYLATEPEKAAEIMAERLRIPREEVIKSYDGIELPNRETNRMMLGDQHMGLAETIQKLEKVLRQKSLLTKSIRRRDIVSSAYIRTPTD